MKLWVDDERAAPDDTWTVVKTSEEAITALRKVKTMNGIMRVEFPAGLSEVSLDHDLGGDDTGMKVLDFMIENRIWPGIISIHTANVPARQRMVQAAHHEAPSYVEIFIQYW